MRAQVMETRTGFCASPKHESYTDTAENSSRENNVSSTHANGNSDNAGQASHSDNAEDLSACTIKQLKERIEHQGLSSDGCIEKQDLIHLLGQRRAGSPISQRQKFKCMRRNSKLFHRRRTLGPQSPFSCKSSSMLHSRKSILRGNPCKAAPIKEKSVDEQRKEIKIILRAKSWMEMLSIDASDLVHLGRAEKVQIVQKRFRKLSRLVHPDKCPRDLRQLATRAFQKLDLGKKTACQPSRGCAHDN